MQGLLQKSRGQWRVCLARASVAAVVVILLGPAITWGGGQHRAGFGARIKISALVVRASQDSPDGAEDDRQSLQVDIQPWLALVMGRDWRMYTRMQVFGSTELTPLESDEGGGLADSFLRLRQLWLDYGGLTPYPGESLRLGLQRLRSHDGLWWDGDIEALVWRFDTTLLKAKVGVAQHLASYRTDRGDLDVEDQGRFNMLGELRYQYRPAHWLGLRLHYQKDNDSLTTVGATMDDDSRLEKREGYWLGLEASGLFGRQNRAGALHYWLQGMGLVGSEDVVQSDPLEPKRVHGWISRDIRAWGVDLGLRYRLPLRPRIEIGGGYAQGSGGLDGDRNTTFMQTGLQSNRSRFVGSRSRLYRFGEVLRPELRNLKVTSLFVTTGVGRQLEATLLAHLFSRDDASQEIVSDLYHAPLVHTSDAIGQEIDIYLGYYWKTWQWFGRQSRAYIRFRGGCFLPGDAYGDQADEPVYRAMLDFYFLF